LSRRELRNLSGSRLTANAAQLSIRDLRLRPLRAVPQPPVTQQYESPLEHALQAYCDGLEIIE
jgi:hypothetical protein